LRRLDHIQRDHRAVTLILCDLDRFHLVNESWGHAAGDAVLVEVGDRLRRVAHDGDLVAWLGADEFAILCEHDPLRAVRLPARLRAAVRRPIASGPVECVLTTSVGLTRPLPGTPTLEALASAGGALFLAKERGRDRTEVFDEQLRLAAITTLTRTAELRQGIARDELALHFQPIVDLATEGIVGYEGLLRWWHPDEGMLAPDSFLHLLESSGLISDLTPLLLTQAAEAACRLDAVATPPPYIAVNVSARQLGDSSLVRHVDKMLERTGLVPERLVLEITESAIVTDLRSAIRTLKRLRERGVGIALDDFGTGYSSLLLLRRLPVTKLKIDRSFVAGCLRDGHDDAIVSSLIDLAAKLGVDCIAEGVELPEQARHLLDLGCPAGQGFLWGGAAALECLEDGAGSCTRRGDAAG
jgi:diguanylate cyclase (GGDEF)-like protein